MIKADLIITDPPYNVNYEGKTKNKLKIKNDNMQRTDFLSFLNDCFNNIYESIKDGGSFYIFCIDNYIDCFMEALRTNNLFHHETLIWVKNTMVLGHLDYHKRHEPILYGWKKGAEHYFTPDRTQTTVYDDKINYKKLKKEELVKILEDLGINKDISTVIYEDKPLRNEEHPTMKPVKLIAKLLINSSRQGETVLDVFGGSGSTLIACEQLKRKCRIMELDPKYCDVIIKRWETLTGRKAELISEK